MASNGTDRTDPSTESRSGQNGSKTRPKQLNQPLDGKDSWIYSTFKKRTCSQFIPSKKEIRRCCCGRLDNDHRAEAMSHIPSSEVTWDVNMHTIKEPTDAYGELEFTGAGQTSRAKYIRISHDTDPEKVLRLLRQEWRLELPKLLISVTGGAKSFLLHPKLKNVLRQGLLKAAETTGAWIITGGTNTGVMRHVGEAVKGHTVMSRGAQLSKDKASELHVIGIATWGIVDHRSDLIYSKGVATYHMTSSLLSEGACLDNNHSHFILVDDGREGKYGGEISFRASLQNCITAKKISRSKSHGIPVVLLVLEGGPNTILTVLESVTSNPAVPVVIAEGSGRAADILAHAHSLVTTNDGTDMEDMTEVVEHQQLLMKIQKAFPECNEEKCISVYHNVLKCVGNKRYITIFRMDEDGIEIDRAILRALLKAQHASAADQLSLALIWNRADIARTEIFTDDQKWEMDALEDAMMDALINNRVEFVNLLLEHGVSMSRFLTTTRLEGLYKARMQSSSSVVFRQIIGKDKVESGFNLADVNSAVKRLLGGTYKGHGKDYNTIRRAFDVANMKMFVDGHHDHISHECHVTNPYKELLLWSVLCNMQKMALFMWERGDENLARALVAGKLYNVMARLTERDDSKADVTDELYAHVEEFKRLALGLLDQCFRTNEEIAQQLLTYNLENWGGQTCLSLAVAIEHEEFLAHVSCQTLLTDIWTGAMKSAHRSSIKAMFGILFPPSIFLLEFKTKRELLSMPVTLEEHEQDLAEEEEETENEQENPVFRDSRAMTEDNRGMELRTLSEPNHQLRALSASRDLHRIPTHQEWTQETRVVHLRWSRKILEFYKAPVTKFWSNVFAYVIFLALFSYVILIRQDKIPSISEIVLIIFVCTLCTEEIRQILHSEPPTLRNKLKEWASSKWNILDGFAVVSFFVGVGLRLHPVTRSAGHVVYCLDVMLWIIRLLDIFSVSKHMGPYVVMIGRMTVDMLYFLLIMMVFLLAYGIAQQAILYPQQDPSWAVVSGVFFRPYFQVYGELFIDDAPDTLSNDTTLFGTPRKDKHGDTIVAFIVAFYLLVANILLLNLLIAIFNNTYNSVQANANQIWKFQRYYLVMEFAQRPVLVPPFIILNHVIHLIKGVYRRLRNCRRRGNKKDCTHSKGLKRFLEKDDLQKMSMFEERCVDGYLREKDTLLHATQEEKIRVIGDRMESVSCQLQDMYKESISQSNTSKKAILSLDTRLTKLEEHTHRIVGLLERLQVVIPPETGVLTSSDERAQSASTVSLSDVEFTGSSSGRGPISLRMSNEGTKVGIVGSAGGRFKSRSESERSSATNQRELEGFTRSRVSTAAARAKKSVARRASRENLTTHVRARQSPYPKSNQQRYPVPDFLVAWQESFPGYDPLLYTAEEVSALPPWADADIMDNTISGIAFNCVENGINRRSHTGLIDVVNRLPRNPVGRTGIAGRGLFGRWGPNHAAHLIATRWKEDKDGNKVQKEGKNVLEFVAVKSSSSLEWAIPGDLVDVGDSISATLRKSFSKMVISALKSTIVEEKGNLEEDVHFIIDHATEIYKGYVDDPRNTDNAWKETVVLNFHDETRETLGYFEFKAEEDTYDIKWQEVSGLLDLQANYPLILRKVSQLRNAYF